MEALIAPFSNLRVPVEVRKRIETFVGMQRYFARAQEEAEMRAQLDAVVSAGGELQLAADKFEAAVEALGDDAEGRYFARLPDGGDVARERTLRAVRRLGEPAREALEGLPRPEPKAETGPAGSPLLAALCWEAKEIFELAGRTVTPRDRGPFVEFVTAITKVMPRDLRRLLPDGDLGYKIRGILRAWADEGRI